jgi:hypothetical protein
MIRLATAAGWIAGDMRAAPGWWFFMRLSPRGAGCRQQPCGGAHALRRNWLDLSSICGAAAGGAVLLPHLALRALAAVVSPPRSPALAGSAKERYVRRRARRAGTSVVALHPLDQISPERLARRRPLNGRPASLDTAHSGRSSQFRSLARIHCR